MSKQRDQFAEVLRKPFEQALRSVDGLLREENGSPLIGMANCQMRVREALAEVDWTTSGLEPLYIGEEAGELEPEGYAERLMAFAFGDAHTVMGLCESLLQREHPDQVATNLGPMLLRSKRSLLKTSFIEDSEKNRLMSGIRVLRETGISVERIAGVPTGIANPIELTTVGGAKRFEWEPSIDAWITARIRPGVGCPAHKHFVEVDGVKVSLVSFFWDKLIQAMYALD